MRQGWGLNNSITWGGFWIILWIILNDLPLDGKYSYSQKIMQL